MNRQTIFGTASRWALAALLVLTLPTVVLADDDDEEECQLDEASIYFELNNTDGDLGIHGLIDADPWKKLEIETEDRKGKDKEQLRINLRSHFRKQGLTELFFESAEPTFDELDPADFFRRFPEGEYDIEVKTLEGDELECEAEVTHLMPAPPEPVVNGEGPLEGCDDVLPSIAAEDGGFTIVWAAIDESHPDLGRTGEPIEIELYEVAVEQEEPEEVNLNFKFAPDVICDDVTEECSAFLPEDLFEGDELKIEVLAREESGNQTATEACFEIE